MAELEKTQSAVADRHPIQNIAVFVSGGGTNLQNLIDAAAEDQLAGGRLVQVIASRPEIYAIERAKAAGIPVEVISRKDHASQAAYDRAVLSVLDRCGAGLLVLAGFLTRLGPAVVAAYPDRILNIHPALLPEFGGSGMYGIRPHEAVLAAGRAVTGATVHFVDEDYDTGRILLQKEVGVLPGDTAEVLQKRVMEEAERVILPEAVRRVIAGLPSHFFERKEEKMMIKRALVSVSDKTGVTELAAALHELGVEILSTGGSASAIRAAGIPVTDVSEVTGFPECLDGRVKTLHPRVHAGILADRSKADHMAFLDENSIVPIDLVVVNLYPFKATIRRPGVDFDTCVENIDIGGPSMVRAAAKNHAAVAVVTDPADYAEVVGELRANGNTSAELRFRLMVKAFAHTAAYDALIADYMQGQLKAREAENDLKAREAGNTDTASADHFPTELTLTWERKQVLRYGENPAQKAAFYTVALPSPSSLASAEQLHGKELSYNNIADADAAVQMVREFDRPACVAVKHANPCGIAVRDDVDTAWADAYEADPVSVFGGIVAFNRPVTRGAAEGMAAIFLEVVIAPDYEADALEILSQKKNIRLLRLPQIADPRPESSFAMKAVVGGILVQDRDQSVYDPAQAKVVTQAQMDEKTLDDCWFGMQVVKYVKSNAIVLVKDGATVGIGPGQVNRITALEIAIKMAGDKAKGSVMASDAFFPFDDCVKTAAAAGIRAIVQPGGSVRDEDSIKACDEAGIPMLFTGQRHFLH